MDTPGPRLAVGVDVGGSGIKAAVVDVASGTLVSTRLRVPTPQPSAPESVVPSIVRIAKRALKDAGVEPKGVRSNSISPGPIETPLLMDWLVKDEEAKRIRLARNPTGRFGKPEEIVHVALYLASDESRWTNGANLVIDGGITVNYF